ncbi:MAG: Flp family type IVb pilin [Chloroflexota bacterium]
MERKDTMSDLLLKLFVWADAVKASAVWALREERGQGMVEYGLILALVAVAAIVVLIALGGGLRSTFEGIVRQIPATPTTTTP